MSYDDMRIFYEEEIKYTQECCQECCFSDFEPPTSEELIYLDQLVVLGILPF